MSNEATPIAQRWWYVGPGRTAAAHLLAEGHTALCGHQLPAMGVQYAPDRERCDTCRETAVAQLAARSA